MTENKESDREKFCEYSSDLAKSGLLSISFDHHHAGTSISDETTDVLGISLSVDNFGEKCSSLLAYIPASAKDATTNVSLIREFAKDYGILGQLDDGILPMVCDGALLNTAEKLSDFYSSCNLHDMMRIQQNVVDLLPDDLKQKHDQIVELIQRASKKKTKREMRGKPANQRSLNKYLRNFELSDNEKQYIGDHMKGLKRTSKVRFRHFVDELAKVALYVEPLRQIQSKDIFDDLRTGFETVSL